MTAFGRRNIPGGCHGRRLVEFVIVEVEEESGGYLERDPLRPGSRGEITQGDEHSRYLMISLKDPSRLFIAFNSF